MLTRAATCRAALTVVAAVLRVSAVSPDAAPSQGFELPAPTGQYAIGTTAWRLVDDSRAETFAAPGERRNVEVLAWYPGRAAGRTRAPYLREGLPEVRTFATMFGFAESTFDALADVRTHAEVDAPIAGSGKLPVLVFSHGYTGSASASTALLEDLASHGYVVLSIVHPYEATAATLANGRVVSLLGNDGKPVAGVRDVFAEWGPEDETMAAVTRATGDDEQRQLTRQYLGTLRNTTTALRRWVDDTKLVIDRLSTLPAASRPGQLAARADLARLGVLGHSMGGVTAGQFCVEDRRCRAGLNLDGIPQYGTMIDATLASPFLMVYSARPGRLGASDAIYARAAKTYYRVDVAETRHLDFCDMTFWGGPLRERPVLGAIAPGRVTEITRTVVRQYFDQELLGRRSPLLAGSQKLPEVAVRKLPR